MCHYDMLSDENNQNFILNTGWAIRLCGFLKIKDKNYKA